MLRQKVINSLNVLTHNPRTLSSDERLLSPHHFFLNKFYIISLSKIKQMGIRIEKYENNVLWYIGNIRQKRCKFHIQNVLQENTESFYEFTKRVAVSNLNHYG